MALSSLSRPGPSRSPSPAQHALTPASLPAACRPGLLTDRHAGIRPRPTCGGCAGAASAAAQMRVLTHSSGQPPAAPPSPLRGSGGGADQTRQYPARRTGPRPGGPGSTPRPAPAEPDRKSGGAAARRSPLRSRVSVRVTHADVEGGSSRLSQAAARRPAFLVPFPAALVPFSASWLPSPRFWFPPLMPCAASCR